MISNWLPQSDVLAHKNVKLFISHCGFGSIVESRYHAAKILSEGWAFKVDIDTLNEKSLSDGITEVLENPKYSETVQQISKLFRDRPMSARETAIFWIEYVIRHHGAPHLQYPGVRLNFWQSNSLDVIAFLIVAFYLIFKVIIFIGKFLKTKLSKSKSIVPKNAKKIN